MGKSNERLYSRYAVEYAAEHVCSHFGTFKGTDAVSQENASCELRNRVVDRQNAADGTLLEYFDDDGQQTSELRFEFVLDEALETFPMFEERQWFLDEVCRLQDEIDGTEADA